MLEHTREPITNTEPTTGNTPENFNTQPTEVRHIVTHHRESKHGLRKYAIGGVVGILGTVAAAHYWAGGGSEKQINVKSAKVFQISAATIDCRSFLRAHVDLTAERTIGKPGSHLPLGIGSVVGAVEGGIGRLVRVGAEFEGANGTGGGEVDMYTCVPAATDVVKNLANGSQELIINTRGIKEIAYVNEANTTVVPENGLLENIGSTEWEVLGSLHIASGTAHNASVKSVSSLDIARAAAVNEVSTHCAQSAWPETEKAIVLAEQQIAQQKYNNTVSSNKDAHYKPYNAKKDLSVIFEGGAPNFNTYLLPKGFTVNNDTGSANSCQVSTTAFSNSQQLENVIGQPIAFSS